jgi:primase-polymerase (primpol)-like protein
MTIAAPPTWLPVVVENIPADLTSLKAWYPALIRPKRNKPGVWDKIPADPETAAPATWSNPETRCTFDDAYMAYQRDPRFHGLGFMMHAEAGLIGVDLDKCVSPDGTVAPWALEIVHQFEGSYWERSVSGTGLRGFCRGTLPVGGCRSKIEGCSVELYADERFLVVTGQVVRP